MLEGSTRPSDERYPQVCRDEMSKQLLSETRVPLPLLPGHPAGYDSEDERQGTGHLFLAKKPLVGKRDRNVTAHRTTQDWAWFLRDLVAEYDPTAETMVLVMDTVHTHTLAALSEVFPPTEARRLSRKLEIHDTPTHGRW